MNQRRASTRWFFCAAAATLPAATLLGLVACSHTGKAGMPGTEPEAVVKTVPVGAARVAYESLSRELVLAAEFRPYQEIDVHAKVAGYVKEIRVDVGDRVQKGQLLATLEIPELKDDLDQAVASTRRSEAEVVRAQSELQRSQSSHEEAHQSYMRLSSVLKARPNLVAQQDIDQALARDRVSEAQVATAQAALAVVTQRIQESKLKEEKVKTLLAYSRIRAPFSGVITRRFANLGAMIQAGTASNTQAMPLVRLSQIDRLRFVLPVPVAVAPQIHIGDPIEVRLPALNKTIRGTVSRFSHKVDTATRTMETEVDVPNPRLQLLPGMYASAVITLERKEHALAVPVQAISGSQAKATVFRINAEKKIEECPVRLGIETPAKVEIVSGLKENDWVIVGNRSQLKPGQKVEPKAVAMGAHEGGE